jgi:hypothetical protein
MRSRSIGWLYGTIGGCGTSTSVTVNISLESTSAGISAVGDWDG